MKRVGVVGLGDMGSGLAMNLIKNGFATTGLGSQRLRMDAFVGMGGKPAGTVAELARMLMRFSSW